MHERRRRELALKGQVALRRRRTQARLGLRRQLADLIKARRVREAQDGACLPRPRSRLSLTPSDRSGRASISLSEDGRRGDVCLARSLAKHVNHGGSTTIRDVIEVKGSTFCG